jgi:hypothetical protein
MTSEKHKIRVEESKQEFLLQVGRLNYVVKLLKESPEVYTDSSLISAVRELSSSFENYINSKIDFTDEYFKKDYWEQTKKD